MVRQAVPQGHARALLHCGTHRPTPAKVAHTWLGLQSAAVVQVLQMVWHTCREEHRALPTCTTTPEVVLPSPVPCSVR